MQTPHAGDAGILLLVKGNLKIIQDFFQTNLDKTWYPIAVENIYVIYYVNI